MDAYIYDWSIDNTDEDATLIRIFCLCENETIILECKDFLYYVYLELPTTQEWRRDKLGMIVDYIKDFNKYRNQQEPAKVELANRKKLYYASQKTFKYIKLYYYSYETAKSVAYKFTRPVDIDGLGNVFLKPHEHNATPILQFTCSSDVPMCGWIHIDREKGASKYDISYKDIHPIERYVLPNPCVMSFDIEVYSSNSNVMPRAKKESDCIFQISCIFNDGATQTNYLLSLGTPNPDIVCVDYPDAITMSFKTEPLLLSSFISLIHKHNPHVIIGYNILGFDMPYIIDRCTMCRIRPSLFKIGMIKDKECREIEDEWSSSAYGKQKFRYIEADGRIWLDLLVYARREFKFDNYKLDTVASNFLKYTKDPFSVKDIFRSYELGVLENEKLEMNLYTSGSNQEEGICILDAIQKNNDFIGLCGKYCLKDSILVYDLFKALDIWAGITEMANVSHVPISYVYTKGQQIKIYSQVYKYCYNRIVVENDAYKSTDTDKYQGATVMDPDPGMYNYVVPFDFKSLYPSIIIAYNIDYSTLVKDYPKIDTSVSDNLCHVISWSEHVLCNHCPLVDLNHKDYACNTYRYRFLKHPKGVIPTIIDNLLTARANTRKHMKQLEQNGESDSTLYNILNKRQLAYKVGSNSMYGGMGVQKGYLPFMAGAMCVTAQGRKNLAIAQKSLTNDYNAEVIYSDTDSCYVTFKDINPVDLYSHSRTVEKSINDRNLFLPPIYLEFENSVYNPFLILTKKRYMYRDYNEDNTNPDYIGSKGVLLSRRDNSGFVRDLYREITQQIFNSKSLDDIAYFITQSFIMCCSASLDQSKFVITKSVNDVSEYKVRDLPTDEKKKVKRLDDLNCTEEEYALRSLPAQVQLAHKLRSRGVRVDTGQRIEYVITTQGGLKAKIFDKIEDIEYQKEFSDILRIEYLYYIDKAVNPIDQMLGAVFKKVKFVDGIYKNYVKKYKMLHELQSLFAPKILIERLE